MKKKGSIQYFSEEVSFDFKNKRKTNEWIRRTITEEGYYPGNINFIFCSDTYLLDLNIQYLNHHTLTDIITFDSSEEEEEVSGDIFISIDRVKENADSFNIDFLNELNRVIIHGVLHLCGHTDASNEEKEAMRKKEDHYLSLQ